MKRPYEAPEGLTPAQQEQFYRLSTQQQKDYVEKVAAQKSAWLARRAAKSRPVPAQSRPVPVKHHTVPAKQQWPPSLVEFANQCRERGRRFGVEEDVSKWLKGYVDFKMRRNELHSTDWSKEPLPSMPSKRKRPAAAAAAAAPPPRGRKKKSVLASSEQKRKRAERFASSTSTSKSPLRAGESLARSTKMAVEAGVTDLSAFLVVGTSTSLEKDYLRLTSAPDPSEVRSLAALERSFEHVVSKFQSNYFALNQQLRAIRQDLTVQRIRNSFSRKVYVFHALLALSNGPDLNEFNQVLTVLVEGGLLKETQASDELMDEFVSYRIVYGVYTKAKYGAPTAASDVSSIVGNATSVALKVRDSFDLRNWLEVLRWSSELKHPGSRSLASLFSSKAAHELVRSLTNVCKTNFAKNPLMNVLPIEISKKVVVDSEDEQLIDVAATKAAFSERYVFPVTAGDNVRSTA